MGGKVSGERACGCGSGGLKAEGQWSYPHSGHTHVPRLRRVPHTAQGRPRGFLTSRKKPTTLRTNQVKNGSRELVLGMTLPTRSMHMCRPLEWVD